MGSLPSGISLLSRGPLYSAFIRATDLPLSLTLLHGNEKSLIMSDFLYRLLAEEEEFLDELADNQHLNESIFNRDQVFAHLNFRLDAGSFKLINTKQSNSSSQTTALPVVEAELSDGGIPRCGLAQAPWNLT